MATIEDLEARVAALEAAHADLDARVRTSEQDAAAARVLAGAADRDVSEFRDEIRDLRRAVSGSLNALRQEMSEGFARVDERFARVDEQFARVDDGFTGIRAKLDEAAIGQQHIAGLLQRLIDDH